MKPNLGINIEHLCDHPYFVYMYTVCVQYLWLFSCRDVKDRTAVHRQIPLQMPQLSCMSHLLVKHESTVNHKSPHYLNQSRKKTIFGTETLPWMLPLGFMTHSSQNLLSLFTSMRGLLHSRVPSLWNPHLNFHQEITWPSKEQLLKRQ